MIRTLRDAENEVTLLKRRLEALEKQVKPVAQATAISRNQVIQLVQENIGHGLDNQPVADGNTIIHKLKHIFAILEVRDILAEYIKTKSIDIENLGEFSQFHISHDATDQGFYITNLATGTFLSLGALWNGSNWIAQNTISITIALLPGTGIQFFYNSALVVGNTFIPTLIFSVGSSGLLQLLLPLGILYGGTGGVNAPDARTNLDVYSKSEVDALIPAGVTGSISPLTAFNLSTTTLQYKNHAGVNSTLDVVTSGSPTTDFLDFTNGIRTT